MFVWVMDGLRQGCYMTICRWNESPVTLECPERGGEIGKSTALSATLHGNLLVCHTKMMDDHCFRVVLYVCLGHGWADTMVLHDNLPLERVSCHM